MCANVSQHIRCEQHGGGRLVVRGLEDAYLVILTECPIHILHAHTHRFDLGGPFGYSHGSLLRSLDALVGELHQTNVCRHDVTPTGNPRSISTDEIELSLCLPTSSVNLCC